MADNTVTIVGNLTRDPELRYTNGGRAVASFGMAVTRKYQVNNEWQEQTSFFNVSAWAQLAENAAQSLTKGSRVIVSGRLEQRQYEARDGGGQRSVVEIVADEIGPSLKWATAVIERTERKTSDDPGAYRGGNSGGYGSADAAAKGLASAGLGGDLGDEEPF